MNWLTFAIMTYLGFALQVVLAPVWPIQHHQPLVLLILLVYIGLQAPAMAVAWSAVVLGLLADIMPYVKPETGVIGPWAIGFLAAGYAMVQLRNLLFRDSMFTIGIMTLIAGIFALLVATTLHAFRGIPLFGNEPVEGFKAANQLYRGFFTLLNTAAFAIPMGYVLLRTRSLWSFSGRGSR
ncbi:MAG: rod shape-determining protein MreD [Planctomycetota bacterium]